ncbi:hypothetical protein M0R45_018795 [Rubus argutus]|uniref:Uncharacterized protein n=1 Tax=Rubus argutus TaxID=59490 RepID=A0AAW1X597_RUBAR
MRAATTIENLKATLVEIRNGGNDGLMMDCGFGLLLVVMAAVKIDLRWWFGKTAEVSLQQREGGTSSWVDGGSDAFGGRIATRRRGVQRETRAWRRCGELVAVHGETSAVS